MTFHGNGTSKMMEFMQLSSIFGQKFGYLSTGEKHCARVWSSWTLLAIKTFYFLCQKLALLFPLMFSFILFKSHNLFQCKGSNEILVPTKKRLEWETFYSGFYSKLLQQVLSFSIFYERTFEWLCCIRSKNCIFLCNFHSSKESEQTQIWTWACCLAFV